MSSFQLHRLSKYSCFGSGKLQQDLLWSQWNRLYHHWSFCSKWYTGLSFSRIGTRWKVPSISKRQPWTCRYYSRSNERFLPFLKIRCEDDILSASTDFVATACLSILTSSFTCSVHADRVGFCCAFIYQSRTQRWNFLAIGGAAPPEQCDWFCLFEDICNNKKDIRELRSDELLKSVDWIRSTSDTRPIKGLKLYMRWG